MTDVYYFFDPRLLHVQGLDIDYHVPTEKLVQFTAMRMSSAVLAGEEPRGHVQSEDTVPVVRQGDLKPENMGLLNSTQRDLVMKACTKLGRMLDHMLTLG